MHRVLSNPSMPHSAAASSGDESDARDYDHARDHAAVAAVGGGARGGLREERARSPTRNRSFTNVEIGAEVDSARKNKRRRGDCACPLFRIAIFLVVFSFMAWITYLFLTKDE